MFVVVVAVDFVDAVVLILAVVCVCSLYWNYKEVLYLDGNSVYWKPYNALKSFNIKSIVIERLSIS